MAGRKPKAEAPVRAANEERGEITLVLDGADFVLRPSHEAIMAFEEATGKGLLQLARDAISGVLRTAEVAYIAAECIRAWGRATGQKSAQGVNAPRIAELIQESELGVRGAMDTIAAVLALASTGGYTAQGEVKATGTTKTSEAPVAS